MAIGRGADQRVTAVVTRHPDRRSPATRLSSVAFHTPDKHLKQNTIWRVVTLFKRHSRVGLSHHHYWCFYENSYSYSTVELQRHDATDATVQRGGILCDVVDLAVDGVKFCTLTPPPHLARRGPFILFAPLFRGLAPNQTGQGPLAWCLEFSPSAGWDEVKRAPTSLDIGQKANVSALRRITLLTGTETPATASFSTPSCPSSSHCVARQRPLAPGREGPSPTSLSQLSRAKVPHCALNSLPELDCVDPLSKASCRRRLWRHQLPLARPRARA